MKNRRRPQRFLWLVMQRHSCLARPDFPESREARRGTGSVSTTGTRVEITLVESVARSAVFCRQSVPARDRPSLIGTLRKWFQLAGSRYPIAFLRTAPD